MVRQRPKDERRETFLSCAADAVKLNKKRKVTLMRWLALILQFQDHNRLARKLADEQGEIDQFRTLMDTFAPRGNFHEGMVNILFKFREWSKLTQYEENPFKERAIYEYLCFANKKKSAGTFADRFLGAIKFFMAKGEFYESAQVTNSERIRSQARLCGDRKKPRREADPLTMAMLHKLETLITNPDTPVELVSIYGFIAFMIGTRTRCGDAAQIIHEPWIEGNHDDALIMTSTVSEATKTGKIDSRRRQTVHVIAHAVGHSNAKWAQCWLKARKHLNQDAAKDECLQQNVNHTCLPIRNTTINSGKITFILRQFLSRNFPEMENTVILKFSAHSCKATLLTPLARRGVDRHIRRLLGYHATGSDQVVELYARDALAHPMVILKSVMNEIRDGLFMPDNMIHERYAPGFSPFTNSASGSRIAPLRTPTTSTMIEGPPTRMVHDRVTRQSARNEKGTTSSSKISSQIKESDQNEHAEVESWSEEDFEPETNAESFEVMAEIFEKISPDPAKLLLCKDREIHFDAGNGFPLCLPDQYNTPASRTRSRKESFIPMFLEFPVSCARCADLEFARPM